MGIEFEKVGQAAIALPRLADPAEQIRVGRERIGDALGRVAQIPLGGTATGTGLNTHPEFAARVRELFDAHRHKFLATLQSDGSPRISGIEMHFVAGEPLLQSTASLFVGPHVHTDPAHATAARA